MHVIPTAISDVLILEPKVFGDSRGFFFESYNEKAFREATGVTAHFVQDNHSRSARGVLRGLHYQMPPAAQAKLVRCVSGEVFDVVVDIRHDSPTFGQWVGAYLSAENHRQMWIPEGFAHGFAVMSEVADFLYMTTDYYNPSLERCIAWNDTEIGIDWPIAEPILSSKDASNTCSLLTADLFF